jgi:hypothetical protein
MERLTSMGRCWTWGGRGPRRSSGRGGGRGGGGRRPRCRSLGAVGGRAHGSGAAAAGAQVVTRDADLSRLSERERGRARDVFLDKTITSVGHL